ncbi:hypothetical protein WN55_01142 [Dufourea novaeangliae]|uniref:Uncharacterized protein n=1 Tax=Dufourea novaeangliae TaxID=178035 RepID=A0A154PE70_DUFNO|nr:hypothetical protein WN55_01142 [Dufourea novaeangliae]
MKKPGCPHPPLPPLLSWVRLLLPGGQRAARGSVHCKQREQRANDEDDEDEDDDEERGQRWKTRRTWEREERARRRERKTCTREIKSGGSDACYYRPLLPSQQK